MEQKRGFEIFFIAHAKRDLGKRYFNNRNTRKYSPKPGFLSTIALAME